MEMDKKIKYEINSNSTVFRIRQNAFLLLVLISIVGFTTISCNLFGGGGGHIDAFGYELEVNGEVIAIYDASGQGTFTIPQGTHFNYNGMFAIGSEVLNEDGYSDIVTIYFWDREGNRQEIDNFMDDGGDGEFTLGWNNTDGQQLDLGILKLEKNQNETWQFRFFTDQRGNTAPESAGNVVIEIWHIDHSDFTAEPLSIYVLTEYEE